MEKIYTFILSMLFIFGCKAQLVINELSNGPSGAKEYVELLVIGNGSPPVCGAANTVDIRGWIIDDNNSWHADSLVGTGIAGGHAKFDSIPQWQNVKLGSLIVVYNDADMSPAVAALQPDTDDANHDCVYIVPISSSVILKNTTLPLNGGAMSTYAVAGTPYSVIGTWPILSMANSDDVFQAVSPANYAAAYHVIGWGIDTIAVNIHFAANQAGKNIYMANAVDNNYFNQANFINASASSNETPGRPNNAANAAWIASLNNNCTPLTPPVISFNSLAPLSCSVSTDTVTASTANGGATYIWGGGQTTSSILVSMAGTYSVTVTNPGGCSASASVSVVGNAGLTISSSAAPATCGNNNGSVTVNVLTGTNPYSYSWNTGATTSSISNLAPGIYNFTVTDAGGCSSTGSLNVAFSGSLVVNLGSDTSLCLPDTITLNATQGGATYLWGDGSTTATILAFQTNEYYVTVTAAGCTGVDSIHVVENPKPPASVTANQTIFCSGDSALICANSGMISYYWNTGETTSCITTQLAGNYYVTITDANGCNAASNHLAISVFPQPPVSISVNGDTLTSYNSVTYQWFLNDNPIAGATSQNYIATQGGSYTVEVTDTNGCAAFSTAVIISGIQSLNNETELCVYPNPNSSGSWQFAVGKELIGSELEIFDVEGRIVLTSNIEHQTTNIEFNAASGIYLLRIVSAHQIYTKKLIKL